jgi:hypothetical protein
MFTKKSTRTLYEYEVLCDNYLSGGEPCGSSEQVEMTSLSAVKVEVAAQGWRVLGNQAICPGCVKLLGLRPGYTSYNANREEAARRMLDKMELRDQGGKPFTTQEGEGLGAPKKGSAEWDAHAKKVMDGMAGLRDKLQGEGDG